MKLLNLAIRYLKYIFTSQNNSSLHSPHVYEFTTNIIYKKTKNSSVREIKNLRSLLYNRNDYIFITDFGAGSSINKSNKRKIKDIAKNSSKNSKYGELLYRIVEFYKPKNILELGTSFGISTCYLAKGNINSKVKTFEGCPSTAKIAQQNFKQLKIKNTNIIVGDFKNTLAKNISSEIDLAFIDGNHNKKSTIEYFEMILKKSNNKTILVFDDIHWSKKMGQAWTYIKESKETTVTIDLFFIGIVFLDKKLSKENYIIRF